MNYQLADKPTISEAEYDALDRISDGGPGSLCGAIRPGTLGYQRCWRIRDHADGVHLSQDMQAWTVDLAALWRGSSRSTSAATHAETYATPSVDDQAALVTRPIPTITDPGDRHPLETLEVLEAEATPSPWQPEQVPALVSPTQIDGNVFPERRATADHQIRADQSLIAAARNALPALLVELREARQEAEARHIATREDVEALPIMCLLMDSAGERYEVVDVNAPWPLVDARLNGAVIDDVVLPATLLYRPTATTDDKEARS